MRTLDYIGGVYEICTVCVSVLGIEMEVQV